MILLRQFRSDSAPPPPAAILGALTSGSTIEQSAEAGVMDFQGAMPRHFEPGGWFFDIDGLEPVSESDPRRSSVL